MRGELTLKKAQPKDGHALFELRYLAYLRPYALDSSPESPCLEAEEDFLARLMEEDGCQRYALWLDDRLVGGAALRPGEKDAAIEELFVDPALQGRGIGGEALRLLESQAPSAVYTLESPLGRQQGLFDRAGYRLKGQTRSPGGRCRMYKWEKEAFRQVEILLSPLRKEHLDAVGRMLSELDEKRLFDVGGGIFAENPDMETLTGVFSTGRHHAGAPRFDYAIEAPELNAVLGLISLTDMDWEVRRARVAHLLVDTRWRGVGLGEQAVQSVCRAACEKYGFRGLTANLLEDNEPALRCFLAAGFRTAYRREDAWAKEGEEPLDSLTLMRGPAAALDADEDAETEE